MNKVILLGRLTKDPESRTTKNSKHMAHFMLAVRRRMAKEGAQNADFLPITAWGTLADFCVKYLKKGQQISLVGKSQSSTWQDVEGKKHYSVDIVADEIYFAENKRNQKFDQSEINEVQGEDQGEVQGEIQDEIRDEELDEAF